jgi:hypothetical protein
VRARLQYLLVIAIVSNCLFYIVISRVSLNRGFLALSYAIYAMLYSCKEGGYWCLTKASMPSILQYYLVLAQLLKDW